MKLVITGIDDGHISYVEGKEVVTSVPQIEARIKEINDTINSRTNLATLINQEKGKASEAIEKMRIEYQAKIDAIEAEFNQEKAEVNEQLKVNITAITENFAREEEEIKKLFEEGQKLKAVLENLTQIKAAVAAKNSMEESIEEKPAPEPTTEPAPEPVEEKVEAQPEATVEPQEVEAPAPQETIEEAASEPQAPVLEAKEEVEEVAPVVQSTVAIPTEAAKAQAQSVVKKRILF